MGFLKVLVVLGQQPQLGEKISLILRARGRESNRRRGRERMLRLYKFFPQLNSESKVGLVLSFHRQEEAMLHVCLNGVLEGEIGTQLFWRRGVRCHTGR